MDANEQSPYRPPPPPADLVKVGRRDGAGRALWREVTKLYRLRPDELRILEHACQQADRIAKLRRAAEGTSMTARGSAGQVIIHPFIKETRELETAQSMLLSKLKLPDMPSQSVPTTEENPRSVSARAAAQARWSKTS